MEVYANGFAGHQGGYFISCESALGVMTGWRALLEYQAAGFSLNAKGFSLNSAYGSRIVDFLRILCKGAGVFACSAKIKFPNSFKNSNVHVHKQKGIITIQMQELKFHCSLPKFQISLVQTSQKACSAQTGDGWSRQWCRRGRRRAPG
jgi:hypothetical protein